MPKLRANATPTPLRNRYRLVIMNDDTYDEVVTFRLSRLSVYILACSVFVILVTLTVSLIVFTPLKEYLPGYGMRNAYGEIKALKIKTDSLEQSMRLKDQYLLNIKKVLLGDVRADRDSSTSQVSKH